jgi:hypothetical protein
MLILFFDSEGIILQHWLPLKQTMNGVYYVYAIEINLRNAIQKK